MLRRFFRILRNDFFRGLTTLYVPDPYISSALQSRNGNKLCTTHTLKTRYIRKYSAAGNSGSAPDFSETQIDKATYERVCSETLEALCEYFEELIEEANHLDGSDVAYSDGVLTVKLGNKFGTYVINRQTPNKQIWLSSPTSGPKRYDFQVSSSPEGGKWIYRHDGELMHELLQRELKEIFREQNINFMKLPYAK